jgi:hypothetical protein
MAELWPPRQRQADLEMKRLSKYLIAFNLLLGITTLAVGGLLMSSQNAIIATQRFAADIIHTDTLEIKGKTFYVTPNVRDEYYFYQHLFLGAFIVGCCVIGAEFLCFRICRIGNPNAR